MKSIDELGISRMPWNTEDGRVWNCDGWLVYDAPYRTESMMPYQQSNARLIAAAPELYECLREAVEDMEEIDCDPDGCSSCLLRDDCKIQNYRYVLAKAAGEDGAQ